MKPRGESLKLLILHEGSTSTLKILERGFQYLKSTFEIDYRVVEFTSRTKLKIQSNEIPLFLRSASPWAASLATQLSKEGRPFYYFVDDDFLSLDIDTDLGKHYRQPLIISSILELLKLSTGVIVNSEVLSRRLSKFSQNVVFIPGFFDFKLLPVDGPSRRQSSPKNGDIRIGFASNITRADDLKTVEKALLQILDDYFNCQIDVIGLVPKYLSGHDRVSVFKHLNSYEEYIKFQVKRNWDIGLAPLKNNKQNAAKTNNKFREYSAMSIAGVYANLVPYHEVRNRETGMLAGHKQSDWLDALKELIENSELRNQISINAYRHVKQNYSIDVIMPLWIELFAQVDLKSTSNSLTWNRRGFHSKMSKFYVVWYVFRTNTISNAFKYFLFQRFK